MLTEALQEGAVDNEVHRRTKKFQVGAQFYHKELKRHASGRFAKFIRPHHLNDFGGKVADNEHDDDDDHDQSHFVTVLLALGVGTLVF